MEEETPAGPGLLFLFDRMAWLIRGARHEVEWFAHREWGTISAFKWGTIMVSDSPSEVSLWLARCRGDIVTCPKWGEICDDLPNKGERCEMTCPVVS